MYSATLVTQMMKYITVHLEMQVLEMCFPIFILYIFCAKDTY
jgi:hypothetical protein